MSTTPYSPFETLTLVEETAVKSHVVESRLSFDSESQGSKLRSNSTTTISVNEVIHAEDDPTLSPWTFRMWFLGGCILPWLFKQLLTPLIGLSLSLFASTVTTISTFKPQPIRINLIFLVVLSHVLGRGLERLIPRKGRIGRFLNPHAVSCPSLRCIGFKFHQTDMQVVVQYQRTNRYCPYGRCSSNNSRAYAYRMFSGLRQDDC